MKRLHLHIHVEDLEASKRFYSALFASEPSVEHPDYIKWEVEDPKLNLAISKRTDSPVGVDHLGIQASDDEELAELQGQLGAAGLVSEPEPDTTCCYAHSNKHWTADPQGLVWEMFHTMGQAETYGHARSRLPGEGSAVCCG